MSIKKSIRKFKRFNLRAPSKMKSLQVDLSKPLIKIGEVPEVTYISAKEGKRIAYKHETSKPYPMLYAHPSGKYFVMIGGRIKIKDWLYG